ncbi:MAG: hypothetical protein GY841_16970 [FCB group bacterium]|nr:hypothetical protein [FCB group bacterium]
MNYGKIISTGFSQAWKYKSLWILGFFVAGGGGGNFSNFTNDQSDGWGSWGNWSEGGITDAIQQILSNPLVLFMIVVAVLALIMIFWVLSTISIGGLIDAAGRLKRNEEYRLGACIKTGLRYFWSIFGLGLLVLIIMMAFVILLALVGVGAFFAHWGIGAMSLIFLIPIFVVGLFMTVITSALAERIIVLENRQVFDAIGDSWSLWRANLGPSVLYTLIYLGISIGIGLATLVLFIFVAVPFVAIGFVNIWVALLLGIPIGLAFLLIVEGFTGAGMHLMTTEFYFQLKEIGRVSEPAPPTPYTPPPLPSPQAPPPPIDG